MCVRVWFVVPNDGSTVVLLFLHSVSTEIANSQWKNSQVKNIAVLFVFLRGFFPIRLFSSFDSVVLLIRSIHLFNDAKCMKKTTTFMLQPFSQLQTQ